MSAASHSPDVLVLGGGAAGLMCALTAAQHGLQVRVLEHTERCGKKILMSGGGRCNFTNTGTTPAQFLSHNPHFCKSALARYAPADFIALVDAHGIGWHEKELGQLFCNESSKQIVRMLLDECAAAGVDIRTGCQVESVTHGDGVFSLATSHGVQRSAKLVIATGGLSIPRMGATGIGHRIAREFGHAIVPTRAGLVPLTLSGKPLEQLDGLAGLAMPVAVEARGATFRNAMLITHRGLSGPAILQVSSYWREGEPLSIDLLPGEDANALLAQWRQSRPDTHAATLLAERLPKRFVQRLFEITHASRPMKQYTPKELEALGGLLKRWTLTPSGTEGYRTAEVTLGGVDTHEISSNTLMSRRVAGLYFVGEVLDVTGWLGGYNFQWAWASGHAAGLALAAQPA